MAVTRHLDTLPRVAGTGLGLPHSRGLALRGAGARHAGASPGRASGANVSHMNPDERPELMTRAEAARRLRVSVTTLARMYDSGMIRAIRVGKGVRIPTAEVDRMIRGEPAEHVPSGPNTPDYSTWPPTPSMLGEDDLNHQAAAEQRRREEDAHRHAERVAAHFDTYGGPHPDDH